ncbi:hypothetical protein [Leptolyngbya ohadii]|uniref:hypothetical protein n=1 Tax=Leptolyngbya ohadii TaxID=1962290 RepID=UPI000B5A1688|nr:hypothetical protein [Leptolyngbya ohadii]
MERGLLWLPLLVLFFWLAWAGWNEYQKVEAYRLWAEGFDRAKYDIYAVLGQKGSDITWGKPTRKGITDLQTFSLQQVQTIKLRANNQTIDPENLPEKAKQAAIEFELGDRSVLVPFTDLELAAQWQQAIDREWTKYRQVSP